MATRSHLETFLLLRNKSVKTRNRVDDVDCEEEKVTLINSNSVRFKDEDEYVDSPPTWVQLVNDFRFEAGKIHKKISQLKEMQESHLRSVFKATSIFENDTEDYDETGREIDMKSQEISRLLARLHALITEMKALRYQNPSSRIISNVLQYEYREICDLTQGFRQCQRQYLNRLQSREKLSQQFVINIDNAMQQSFNEETYENYMDNENSQTLFVQKQVDPFLVDTETLKERDAEMTVILKSMSELNQIFQDINATVINQGTLLDRIDYNIENVRNQVEEGVIQLSKAERSLRNSRKLKFILFLSFSAFILLLIFIMRS